MFKKLYNWVTARITAFCAATKQRHEFHALRTSDYYKWVNHYAAMKIEDCLNTLPSEGGYSPTGDKYMCIALRSSKTDPKYYSYDKVFKTHAISMVCARINFRGTLAIYLGDTENITLGGYPTKQFVVAHGIPFYRKLIKDMRT